MKAINKNEHQAIVEALQQMANLLADDLGNAVQDIETLSELYRRYQSLVADLSVCIAEYETLHRYLKTRVLAPALRKARRREEYQ